MFLLNGTYSYLIYNNAKVMKKKTYIKVVIPLKISTFFKRNICNQIILTDLYIKNSRCADFYELIKIKNREKDKHKNKTFKMSTSPVCASITAGSTFSKSAMTSFRFSSILIVCKASWD